MTVEHPKLFISYSHDTDAHKQWVLKLATDLRQHMGVDVILDQWDLRIGSDLSLFMEQGLSSASLVLCVCSDQYVKKANAGTGGAGYEKMIMTAALIQNTNTDYIIPVMRCNSEKNLPTFLSTKLYVDFSDESKYLEKLGDLTARIYEEDIAHKPPLGKSPYSESIQNDVVTRTEIAKSQYHSPQFEGCASFDFKNNSGQFIIGSGEYEFCTRWSECGSNSIYAYRDKVKMIGYAEGVDTIPSFPDFEQFDFTSRTREPHIGEVNIWMNKNGKFAATLITDISVKSRGAKQNNLSFEYKIYS